MGKLLQMAKFFAVIFHPAFLFPYLFLVLSLRNDFPGGIQLWIAIAVVLTVVLLPLLFTYIKAKDIYLRERKKRIVPLFVSTLTYAAALAVFYFLGMPFSIKWYLLASAISLATVTIVNLKIKMSLHGGAFGAMIGFIIISFLQWVPNLHMAYVVLATAFLLITPLVMWQRIATGAHRGVEVALGLTAGIVIAVLSFLISLQIF